MVRCKTHLDMWNRMTADILLANTVLNYVARIKTFATNSPAFIHCINR